MPFAGVQAAEVTEAATSDQQSSWSEAGRADAAVVVEAHRQHRVDLLHVFHYFRHFRRSSEYASPTVVLTDSFRTRVLC